jgi:hypothetical protein
MIDMTYDPEADAAYIYLGRGKIVEIQPPQGSHLPSPAACVSGSWIPRRFLSFSHADTLSRKAHTSSAPGSTYADDLGSLPSAAKMWCSHFLFRLT